jgi:hypothetical protein
MRCIATPAGARQFGDVDEYGWRRRDQSAPWLPPTPSYISRSFAEPQCFGRMQSQKGPSAALLSHPTKPQDWRSLIDLTICSKISASRLVIISVAPFGCRFPEFRYAFRMDEKISVQFGQGCLAGDFATVVAGLLDYGLRVDAVSGSGGFLGDGFAIGATRRLTLGLGGVRDLRRDVRLFPTPTTLCADAAATAVWRSAR